MEPTKEQASANLSEKELQDITAGEDTPSVDKKVCDYNTAKECESYSHCMWNGKKDICVIKLM